MDTLKVSKQEMKKYNFIIQLASNQVILNDTKNNMVEFISYNTLIARYNMKTSTLTLNLDWWDYSNTTRKYFKQFINSYTSLEYTTKKDFVNTYKIGGIYA